MLSCALGEGFLNKTDLSIFLWGTDCSHRKYDCPEMMLYLALSSFVYYPLFLPGVISGTLWNSTLCHFFFLLSAPSQSSSVINNHTMQCLKSICDSTPVVLKPGSVCHCPPWDSGNVWRHFWLSQLGRGRCCPKWGLRMLLTSYNTRDGLQPRLSGSR